MSKVFLILAGAVFSITGVQAQRDTTKTQAIDITSSFKPVLRNAVKINFSGSQLSADSSRPVLGYTIPSQNLFYSYQPISLKPLALTQDTNLYLGGRNYLKAGFGSFNTPILAAAIGFGDGKTSLASISASYIGSKGTDIEYQDYNMLQVKGTGSYFKGKDELYGGATVSLNNYYLYGYDHQLYNYTKADVRQQFQEINLAAGVRNIVSNEAAISYNPNVQLSFFTNKDKLSETTIIVDAPAQKRINDEIIFKLAAKADLTNYATKNSLPANFKYANNVFQIAPAFEYTTDLINFHGGLTPTWSNGKFNWLPDVYAEIKLQERAFLIQAGMVGRYVKNSFRNLSAINPYLANLSEQRNTKELEYYAGIKATIGSHFNFNAKASWIGYRDFALFINDTATDQKSFQVVYEPEAKNVRLHGDVSYVNQDKLSLTAGLTLNGYTDFNVNNKAWHTLPMEFTGSAKWWAYKRLLLKADLYLFNGGSYVTKLNDSRALTGGTDLSLGGEYKINKQFSAWLNANNILNDKYERWHNYQVYGLNLTAGVLINF